MGVVHHHPLHTFVNSFFRLEPEANVDGTIVLLVLLVKVNTLRDTFDFVLLFTDTYEMKTIDFFHSFTVLFVTNFKLNFIPKTILVVRRQSFLGSFELSREWSQVHEVCHTLIWIQSVGVEGRHSLKIIKLTFHQFADWFINLHILSRKLIRIYYFNILHLCIIYGHKFFIYSAWSATRCRGRRSRLCKYWLNFG